MGSLLDELFRDTVGPSTALPFESQPPQSAVAPQDVFNSNQSNYSFDGDFTFTADIPSASDSKDHHHHRQQHQQGPAASEETLAAYAHQYAAQPMSNNNNNNNKQEEDKGQWTYANTGLGISTLGMLASPNVNNGSASTTPSLGASFGASSSFMPGVGDLFDDYGLSAFRNSTNGHNALQPHPQQQQQQQHQEPNLFPDLGLTTESQDQDQNPDDSCATLLADLTGQPASAATIQASRRAAAAQALGLDMPPATVPTRARAFTNDSPLSDVLSLPGASSPLPPPTPEQGQHDDFFFTKEFMSAFGDLPARPATPPFPAVLPPFPAQQQQQQQQPLQWQAPPSTPSRAPSHHHNRFAQTPQAPPPKQSLRNVKSAGDLKSRRHKPFNFYVPPSPSLKGASAGAQGPKSPAKRHVGPLDNPAPAASPRQPSVVPSSRSARPPQPPNYKNKNALTIHPQPYHNHHKSPAMAAAPDYLSSPSSTWATSPAMSSSHSTSSEEGAAGLRRNNPPTPPPWSAPEMSPLVDQMVQHGLQSPAGRKPAPPNPAFADLSANAAAPLQWMEPPSTVPLSSPVKGSPQKAAINNIPGFESVNTDFLALDPTEQRSPTKPRRQQLNRKRSRQDLEADDIPIPQFGSESSDLPSDDIIEVPSPVLPSDSDSEYLGSPTLTHAPRSPSKQNRAVSGSRRVRSASRTKGKPEAGLGEFRHRELSQPSPQQVYAQAMENISNSPLLQQGAFSDGGEMDFGPSDEEGGVLPNGMPKAVICSLYRVQQPEPGTINGKTFHCEVSGCGRVFPRKNAVENHIQTHLESKPFVCLELGCGAAFVRQHDLKRHERIHLDSKPYVCDCGKTFSRTDALMRHRGRGTCGTSGPDQDH